MSSIHEVTQVIYDLEEELNLIHFQYHGDYVYSFMRTRIVSHLQQQLGLVKQAHDTPKRRTKWQRYWDFVSYDLKYLFHRKQYDIIVIEHERQIEVDGTYIDIYTDELVKQKSQHNRVMCVRRAPKRDTLQAKGKQILLRQGFLDRFDATLQKQKKYQDRLPIFDTLSQRLNEHFSTNIDVNAIFLKEWPNFIRTKRRFMRWLKKYQPNEVIVVVGYYCYEYIAACKECKIKVSEVQHGLLDAHHSGYSYPYQAKRRSEGNHEKLSYEVPYFVDHFYAFQPYWTQNCPLPLGEEGISYIGFLHFRKQTAQYLSKKHPYQVLVISQGPVGEQLVNLTIDLATKHPDYTFVYKLHPGEFLHYKERYPQLLTCPENMWLVQDEIPLYQWMSTAKYMIGAFSTAIYEGLAMHCQVMLVNAQGVSDYMKYLIDHEVVSIINDSEDFMECKDVPRNAIADNIF